MPNIKSAVKRVELTKVRTLRNARLRSALRTVIRKYEDALTASNRELAQTTLHRALVVIDKSVTKGILHKNAAARKKSRLTKRFNKLVG